MALICELSYGLMIPRLGRPGLPLGLPGASGRSRKRRSRRRSPGSAGHVAELLRVHHDQYLRALAINHAEYKAVVDVHGGAVRPHLERGAEGRLVDVAVLLAGRLLEVPGGGRDALQFRDGAIRSRRAQRRPDQFQDQRVNARRLASLPFSPGRTLPSRGSA